MFPKCVYHKDYDSKSPEQEKALFKLSKIVHSKEQLESLGPDWGPHPSKKSENKISEEKIAQTMDEALEPAKKYGRVKK